MPSHGPASPRIASHRLTSPGMASHGLRLACLRLASHALAWLRMASHRLAWSRLASHGLAWPCMCSHRPARLGMARLRQHYGRRPPPSPWRAAAAIMALKGEYWRRRARRASLKLFIKVTAVRYQSSFRARHRPEHGASPLGTVPSTARRVWRRETVVSRRFPSVPTRPLAKLALPSQTQTVPPSPEPCGTPLLHTAPYSTASLLRSANLLQQGGDGVSMCVQVTHRSGRAGARSRPIRQRERQGTRAAAAVVRRRWHAASNTSRSRWVCLHGRSPQPGSCIQRVWQRQMLY